MNATISKTDLELTGPLQALGFTLETISGPRGVVEPAKDKDSKPWLCLRFSVVLSHNSNEVLTTVFSFGIGHVDLSRPKVPPSATLPGWKSDDVGFLAAWQRQPHADFKDKRAQVRVAEMLAREQGLRPTLPGVLSSLLMDGEAHGQTFEEWADNFGYDSDSRKAEEIFRACDSIGRKLRVIDATVIGQARELLQDY